jgi:hypothetical protein
MQKDYQEIYDSEDALDENGMLRDGHRARYSLMFKDSSKETRHTMTDAERYVLQDAEWRARTAYNRPVSGLSVARVKNP